MRDWTLQEAKSRLSELTETALKKGPQAITQNGERTVVIVPAGDWDRLTGTKPLSAKGWLLGEPRFDLQVPSRKKVRRRAPPEL